MKQYKLINGNSAEELKQFPDNHFDSVITDPPYGINFLGKEWDKNTGEEEVYRQCFRVLKPGGHLLAFSAARTYHHLAMAVERSGFEIRDQIMWVYGSGFPKSQDVGRQIDKAAGKTGIKGPLKRGAERLINATDSNGNRDNTNGVWANEVNRESHIILPETEAAKQWSGWGSALKPAHEPIVMAQKPFPDAIYKNVQKWGVGAINVDDCRVSIPEEDRQNYVYNMNGTNRSTQQQDDKLEMWNGKTGFSIQKGERTDENLPQGRFPANFIHDGSDEVVKLFPDNCGNAAKATRTKDSITGTGHSLTKAKKAGEDNGFYDGLGSAARFFYQAKVSKSERNIGFGDNCKTSTPITGIPYCDDCGKTYNGTNDHSKCDPTKRAFRQSDNTGKEEGNNHPTVKPVALMKYLVTLVTPKGGKVLDPFNGSGSTGMACVELGMDYTGIDLDPNYIAISTKRIEAWWDKCNPTPANPFANDLFTEDK